MDFFAQPYPGPVGQASGFFYNPTSLHHHNSHFVQPQIFSQSPHEYENIFHVPHPLPPQQHYEHDKVTKEHRVIDDDHRIFVNPEIEKLEAKIHAKEKELEKAMRDNEERIKKHGALTEQQEKNTAQKMFELQQMEKKLASVENELRHEIQIKKNENDRITHELNNLKQTHSDNASELSLLQIQKQEIETELNALKQEKLAVHRELDDEKARLLKYEEEIHTIKEENQRLNSHINTISTESTTILDKSSVQLEKCLDDIKYLKEKIKKKEALIKKKDIFITNLQAIISEKETKITDLKAAKPHASKTGLFKAYVQVQDSEIDKYLDAQTNPTDKESIERTINSVLSRNKGNIGLHKETWKNIQSIHAQMKILKTNHEKYSSTSDPKIRNRLKTDMDTSKRIITTNPQYKEIRQHLDNGHYDPNLLKELDIEYENKKPPKRGFFY